MKKLFKTMAVCLSLLMMFSVFSAAALAEETTDSDKYIISAGKWGVTEFGNLSGAGLTTDLDGKYSVVNRATSIGNCGYGIWAYLSPSVGNYLSVKAGHTYLCEVQVWVEDYCTPDPSSINWTDSIDNWFNADCWVYAPVDKTYTSTPLTRADYEKAAVEFDATYGYPYKTLEVTIEIPETDTSNGETIVPEGESEFRFYTNGFTDFKHYRMYVYDMDESMLEPVLDMDASVSNPYNVAEHLADPDGYVECDNCYVNPGMHISKVKTSGASNASLVGNVGKTLAAGNYSFDYSLDYTYIDSEDQSPVFTVEITKNGQPFGTKSFSAAELPADGNLSVPFVADEKADYRASLNIFGNASFTLKGIELKRTVDKSYFDELRDAINAIGEVKYDPDVNEDSKELIDKARNIYNAILADLGDFSQVEDLSPSISVLVNAEATYSTLVNQYNDMLSSAKLVDEAIDSIPSPVTVESEEYIVASEIARDSFIETYSQEKAELHIKKLADLAKAREDFDKLVAEDIVYGDVDGDKSVTANDALEALQASIGARQLDEKATKAADVDKDEKVTANDALCILQFTVGARDILPVA